MLLDAHQYFSFKQGPSASSATIDTVAAHASTNVYDLGATGTPWLSSTALDRDIALGNPMPILIKVDTTFTSGGSATLTVAIQTDDNAGFSSATSLWTSSAIAVASLVRGLEIFSGYINTNWALERYLRVLYTVGTAAMTAGLLTASIGVPNQTNQ